MTAKKMMGYICLVLSIIAFINLLVSHHNYNATYNIWAEEEDLKTSAIVSILVILVIVVIFMIIMIPAIKKAEKITNGKTIKKPNPDIIRRNSMNSIMTSILGIILFLIISQETVYRFGISTLNMNIAEAEFLAGEYQIYKKHLLFIIIITLIQSIVNYFTTESDCIDTNDSNYNASKQIYYHEINEKTCSDGKSYIICPSCGIEQPSNYKECWNCNFKFSGTKAMKDSISKCPNCGAVITEEMLFCGNCGNKLKEQ